MHIRRTWLIAMAILWLPPLTAHAAVSLSVETPVIAGLGTQIHAQGLAPSRNAHISVLPPAGDERLLPVRANAEGNIREELRGEEMQRAGTYTLTIEAEGRTIAGPETFTVLPDSLDARISIVEALTSRIQPDGGETAEIVVQLMDRYGNPLPSRPVILISSRTVDDIVALGQQTDRRGEIHFLVSTQLPGAMSLRALDLLSGNTLASSVTVTAGSLSAIGGETRGRNDRERVSARRIPLEPRFYYAQTAQPFDVIDHFEVTVPKTLPAGEEAPRIVVRAVDRQGRTVEDYIGTVVFSSTDLNATLPNFGRYEFKERDLGRKEFSLVLKFERGGSQTLRVEDLNDPAIAGEATIAVEGSTHAASPITVTSHKTGDAVNTTTITIEGRGPRFANLIVMGGQQDTPGATDKDGNFSIPVELNPARREITIRVRDDAGRNDSGPIDLIFDNEVPIIGTITFSPERPKAGDKVLIIVQSEPSLTSMTMMLAPNNGEPVTLSENATSSGSYQAFFTAPEEGAYQPVVTATDRAGNTTDVRTTFLVGLTALPIVRNLRGQAKMGAAALEWDPVQEDVEGYRVYVGERPDNFLYTLDTRRATTKANVAGLSPGRTYYFAVTAVAGKKESGEKSEVLKLDIPGLVLNVMESDSKLLLEWLPPKISLHSYTLEYGVVEGIYTEKRTVPARRADGGKPQAHTVSDLLNGVTYYLRLTPVTITGDVLKDMAATGRGAPKGGEGFAPLPGDPIPPDLEKLALKRTPKNSTTGLPAPLWLGIGTVVLLLCGWQWHRRMMQRQHAAFLATIQSRYR